MRNSSKNEYNNTHSPSSSLLFVCRQHSCDSSWIDRDYYMYLLELVIADLLYCLLSLLSASLSSLSGGSLNEVIID